MRAFLDYYRCPADKVPIGTQSQLSAQEGYFTFGGTVGFGRIGGGRPATHAADPLTDLAASVTVTDGRHCLPFDISDVVTNLREERYQQNGYNWLRSTRRVTPRD